MKLNGMVAGLVLASVVLVAGCGERKEQSAEKPAAPAPEDTKAAADVYSGGEGDFSNVDPMKAGRGGEIYATVCASCHDKGLNRAPQRAMLSLMTPESINRALTTGVMKEQADAAELTADDKVKVADQAARPSGRFHMMPTAQRQPLEGKVPRTQRRRIRKEDRRD